MAEMSDLCIFRCAKTVDEIEAMKRLLSSVTDETMPTVDLDAVLSSIISFSNEICLQYGDARDASSWIMDNVVDTMSVIPSGIRSDLRSAMEILIKAIISTLRNFEVVDEERLLRQNAQYNNVRYEAMLANGSIVVRRESLPY